MVFSPWLPIAATHVVRPPHMAQHYEAHSAVIQAMAAWFPVSNIEHRDYPWWVVGVAFFVAGCTLVLALTFRAAQVLTQARQETNITNPNALDESRESTARNSIRDTSRMDSRDPRRAPESAPSLAQGDGENASRSALEGTETDLQGEIADIRAELAGLEEALAKIRSTHATDVNKLSGRIRRHTDDHAAQIVSDDEQGRTPTALNNKIEDLTNSVDGKMGALEDKLESNKADLSERIGLVSTNADRTGKLLTNIVVATLVTQALVSVAWMLKQVAERNRSDRYTSSPDDYRPSERTNNASNYEQTQREGGAATPSGEQADEEIDIRDKEGEESEEDAQPPKRT